MITRVYFETFLKRHRALRRYKRNLVGRKDLTPSETYKFIISNFFPSEWILSAFIWAESHEGDEYWAQMHHLWKKEIDKIKRKEAKA